MSAAPVAAPSMEETDIERRTLIAFSVDDPRCHGCGRDLPEGVASNPKWWIDSEVREDGVEYATIYCPSCW